MRKKKESKGTQEEFNEVVSFLIEQGIPKATIVMRLNKAGYEINYMKLINLGRHKSRKDAGLWSGRIKEVFKVYFEPENA